MPNERIKNSSHICPQTMGCQRSQASSHASPGSSQLTDREETIPACVCLPTFQHHHHLLLLLGTAGRLLLLLLLLCGAAGRRIVSLEQLVHLPLHLWRVALAVALGDGEPLAHGGRRQTGSLFRRCERDEKMKKKNKNFWSAGVGALVVKFRWLDRTAAFFFCQEIRCVIATGPSHQPVSARPVQRVWVLEPINIATNQINNIGCLIGILF